MDNEDYIMWTLNFVALGLIGHKVYNAGEVTFFLVLAIGSFLFFFYFWFMEIFSKNERRNARKNAKKNRTR